MPRYTYKCSKCEHIGDIIHKMDDTFVGVKCDRCGKGKLKKVIQAAPVVFKGSGFYKTDSRK